MIGGVGFPIRSEDIEEIQKLAIRLGITIEIEDISFGERTDKTVSYFPSHPRAKKLDELIFKSQKELKETGTNN